MSLDSRQLIVLVYPSDRSELSYPSYLFLVGGERARALDQENLRYPGSPIGSQTPLFCPPQSYSVAKGFKLMRLLLLSLVFTARRLPYLLVLPRSNFRHLSRDGTRPGCAALFSFPFNTSKQMIPIISVEKSAKKYHKCKIRLEDFFPFIFFFCSLLSF